MLITSAKRGCSFSGSLAFLALAGGLLWGNLGGLTVGALTLGRVFTTGLCAALALFVVGNFRLAWVRRGGRLAVRTLFGSETVNPETCALGISVAYGTRGGAIYTVYAADGLTRVELADFWTRGGAERGLRRLRRCFCSDEDSSRRARARARVAAEQQQWEGSVALAQQQVQAYYASGKHRRVGYWLLGGVLAYLLVMLLMAWFTGTPR